MGERNSRPIGFWIDADPPRVPGEIGTFDDGSPLLRPVYDLSRPDCSPLTRNNQPLNRNGPNRPELRRDGDRFQPTTVPNDLELAAGSGPVLQPPPTASSLPSPGYWNQYGGQESGVNTRLTEQFVSNYRDGCCLRGRRFSVVRNVAHDETVLRLPPPREGRRGGARQLGTQHRPISPRLRRTGLALVPT